MWLEGCWGWNEEGREGLNDVVDIGFRSRFIECFSRTSQLGLRFDFTMALQLTTMIRLVQLVLELKTCLFIIGSID